MKRISRKLWAPALLALALAGCGGEEATPTPAPTQPPTATVVPATATPADAGGDAGAAAEPASPLAEPPSPLAQPPSPLDAGGATGAAAPAAGAQGPHIEIAVPSDIGVITQLAQETKSSAPQEGMASLSGVLYSPVINRIIPGTQFYLTPALEKDGELFIPTLFDGPNEAEGDVVAISNERGQIMLDDVPPGNYYMAVWTIYNWPLAFGGPDEKLPLLITVDAGDQQDLGLLYVEWP